MKYLTVFCALLASIFIVKSAQADFFDDNDFDGSDLSVCADAFGASSDQSNYHAACDFILDGDVDLVDLRAFAARFGKKNCYPPAAVGEVGPEGGTVEVTDNNSSAYGTIAVIPVDALSEITVITIATVESPPNGPGNNLSQLTNFAPPEIFQKKISVFLEYPDDDSDGVIDGTVSPETDVAVFQYDENGETWTVFPPDSIDTTRNNIRIDSAYFSTWSCGLSSIDPSIPENSGEPLKYVSLVGVTYSDDLEISVGGMTTYFKERTPDGIEMGVPPLPAGTYPVSIKIGNVIYDTLELEVLELSPAPDTPGEHIFEIQQKSLQLIDILIGSGELTQSQIDELSEAKTELENFNIAIPIETLTIIEAALYRDNMLQHLENSIANLEGNLQASEADSPIQLMDTGNCTYGSGLPEEYFEDNKFLASDSVGAILSINLEAGVYGLLFSTGLFVTKAIEVDWKEEAADYQCEDGEFCSIHKCNYTTGKCYFEGALIDEPCQDGIACTSNSKCTADGKCVGTPDHSICGGQDIYDADCNYGICDPYSGCIDTRFEPSGLAGGCDDGDTCTNNDRCDGAGNCIGDSICL